MSSKFTTSNIIVVTLSVAGFAPPAMAYLDPGTGGMIVSAIVGIFATIGLALKTYWYKLKSLFSRKEESTDTAREAVDAGGTADSRQES